MLSDDLDLFFDTAEFAKAAMYDDGSGPVAVTVIFERPYVSVEMGGVPSEARQPHVLGRESEFPNVAPGHTLVIDSVSYTVVPPVQSDGYGLVTLFLKKT